MQYRWCKAPITAEVAQREITMSLGGPIAELRWRRKSRHAVIEEVDEIVEFAMMVVENRKLNSDFAKAMEMMGFLHQTKHAYDDFIAAWLQTEQIIHTHWQRIIAFADLLKTELKLEGPALLAAISRVYPDHGHSWIGGVWHGDQ